MTDFCTKDLAQAAFLWLQDGVEMVNTTCSGPNGQSVFFHFSIDMSEDDRDKLLFAYANGNATVEPHAFMDYMSRLRVFLSSRYSDGSNRRQVSESRKSG